MAVFMLVDGARGLPDGRDSASMKAPLPIEIVGGGLAGLSVGLALRREGIPVTIFEAGDYPRHRVCGEFIAGLNPSTIDTLGLHEILADARPHDGVTYYLRGRPLRPYRLPRTAWGISRYTLDTRLAKAFVATGGDLRTHVRVPESETPPGRIFAAGRKRKGPFWVGLKVHVRNFSLSNDFEVHLGDRAYVGLSRVESGNINVCGLFAHRDVDARGADLLTGYLAAAGLAALAERLRAADVDHDSRCVTAAPLGDRRVVSSDRIWLGDACASIAPFTGNGLAMALQGAEIALAPLRAYASGFASWGDSIRAVARAQGVRFRRRLLVSSLLHPFFLERRRQECLAALSSLRLIPFRACYAALH
jgi:2-polyprenyl-6-methoxyphenol hydroxylase-like FAD-dependent oxidoreductase